MNSNNINTAWLKSNTLSNTTSDNKAQNIEEKYSNRFNQLVRQDRPHSQAKKETFDDNNFYPMYWTQRFIKGDPSTIRYGMQPPPEPHDDPSIVIYGMQPPPEPHDDPSIIRYGMQPPPDDNPNLHHLYNIEVLPDKPVFLRPKPEFVQNKDKNLEFDNTQFMKIFTNLFAVFSSALGNAVGQIRR
jgi:hypothetical protein